MAMQKIPSFFESLYLSLLEKRALATYAELSRRQKTSKTDSCSDDFGATQDEFIIDSPNIRPLCPSGIFGNRHPVLPKGVMRETTINNGQAYANIHLFF